MKSMQTEATENEDRDSTLNKGTDSDDSVFSVLIVFLVY